MSRLALKLPSRVSWTYPTIGAADEKRSNFGADGGSNSRAASHIRQNVRQPRASVPPLRQCWHFVKMQSTQALQGV
jgi:hypothetical protein